MVNWGADLIISEGMNDTRSILRFKNSTRWWFANVDDDKLEEEDAKCEVNHLNCKEALVQAAKWYKRTPKQIDVFVVSVQKLLED